MSVIVILVISFPFIPIGSDFSTALDSSVTSILNVVEDNSSVSVTEVESSVSSSEVGLCLTCDLLYRTDEINAGILFVHALGNKYSEHVCPGKCLISNHIMIQLVMSF